MSSRWTKPRQGRRAFLGALLAALACGVSACGRSGSAPTSSAAADHDAGVVNLYTWSDYLGPNTIADFEKETGIKVRVAFFDTNETLESRILTGNSGYDVVVPTAPYLERQIASGAYLALDKGKLPNLAHLDSTLMSRVAQNDPGNAHAVIYMWGTYGIGYNETQLAQALPGEPIDSWRLLFDPAFASRLARCGIGTIDAPAGVERLVLRYLGRDPNAPTDRDLADVEAILTRIRPYVRMIDSANIIDAVANGDICIALGYNGDFVQSRNRAREARNGIKVNFIVPKEGSLLWFDMLAIPKDAPHPDNAHALINYLMTPRVIADVSNFIGFANANTAATPLLDPAIAADPIIFPPPDQLQRLFVQEEDHAQQLRAITRIWQRFKTAQ
jgi:putrescine transport system substrate-binding protein